METVTSRLPLPAFSFLFAQESIVVRGGSETAGAETELETSQDGIVRKDQVEDGDVG